MKKITTILTASAVFALTQTTSFAQDGSSQDPDLGQHLAVDSLHVAGAISTGVATTYYGDVLPALTLETAMSGSVTIASQTLVGSPASWEWRQYSEWYGTRRVLLLEDQGKLTLSNTYMSSSTDIVLDASNSMEPKITIAGSEVLTQQNIGRLLTVSSLFGDNSSMGGDLALGYYAYAYGAGSATAFGANAHAEGYSSTALGHYATAQGSDATALGYMTSAYGDAATALGYSAVAGGYSSVAIGSFVNTYYDATVAIGYSSNTNGYAAIALGYGNYANGDSAIAIGRYANASAYALALGDYAYADSTDAIAIGSNAQTSNYVPGQIVIGSHNVVLDDAAFIIGNGTIENGTVTPSNLFVIKTDGKGVFRHVNYTEPTPENPAPPQGEALRVEGTTMLKGDVRIRGNTTIDGELILNDATRIKSVLIVQPAGDLPVGPFTSDDE